MFIAEDLAVYTSIFDSLGINYIQLSESEINRYKQQWIDVFAPKEADKKEIEKICLSYSPYTPYLWHIFSYKILNPEIDCDIRYNQKSKYECVVLDNIDDIGFIITNANNLTAEIIQAEFTDVTIFPSDFSWTYCKTHEASLGPYFYLKKP